MVRKATQKVKKSKKSRFLEKRKLKQHGERPLDLLKSGRAAPLDQEALPANGQFGCEKCDRYFIDEKMLEEHFRTRAHKRRVKEWNEHCHTREDAERAAGLCEQEF